MATTREIVREEFHKVIGMPPARVKAVRRKEGKKAAEKVQAAIALDEARKRGAKVPRND